MITLALALLLPGGRPRETVSGYLGRKAPHSGTARLGAAVVDACCWWEPGHCAVVAREEAAARREHGYE